LPKFIERSGEFIERSRERKNNEAAVIQSTKAQLMTQVGVSLQKAGVAQNTIDSLLKDIDAGAYLGGVVRSIQSSPQGGITVRVISEENDSDFVQFQFPSPNKSDWLVSELQRAQNGNLHVLVVYSHTSSGYILELLNVFNFGPD
jgi:hypothetical protein